MKSYVVIGGGLAGLTAANALAGNGNRVTLLERSSHLGGRAQTQRQQGFLLNLGPHALYRGGIAMQTLSAWKIPFSGRTPPAGERTYFVREDQLYPQVRDLTTLLTTRLFNAQENWKLPAYYSRSILAMHGAIRPCESGSVGKPAQNECVSSLPC